MSDAEIAVLNRLQALWPEYFGDVVRTSGDESWGELVAKAVCEVLDNPQPKL